METIHKYAGADPYQTIPESLIDNAIALYTTRPQGLSDFALPLTNAVTNGDFSQGTTGYFPIFGALSVLDGKIINTADGTASTHTIITSSLTPVVIASKWAYAGYAEVGIGCTKIEVFIDGSATGTNTLIKTITNPAPNQAHDITAIGTIGSDFTGNIKFLVSATYATAGDANGKQLKLYPIIQVNLSTPFGLTNEPTATEFADMLTYKGKTFWNGTESVVINPNDKYYWPDRSGNGRHLHAVNVAYDATGGVQAGPPANWLCDGVNDYLVYNSATDIVAANGAVSAFVVFQAVGAVAAVHRTVNLSDGVSGGILFITASPTAITASALGTSNAVFSQSTQANKWYSALLGFTTAKKTNLSVNGGTIVESAGTADTTAIKKLTISANATLTGYNNDRISEVYLFNKVLTQAEIKSLHNNIASRYGLTKV